jgi:hypothetical protein
MYRAEFLWKSMPGFADRGEGFAQVMRMTHPGQIQKRLRNETPQACRRGGNYNNGAQRPPVEEARGASAGSPAFLAGSRSCPPKNLSQAESW